MPKRCRRARPGQSHAEVGPVSVSLSGVECYLTRHQLPLFSVPNCEIAPGQLAVLFGISGSGKTTLADMLLGLIEPDCGEIELGGVSINHPAGRAQDRRRITYVPQDPFLFDQSLRQNLLWAEPGASETQLWEALEQAEAA